MVLPVGNGKATITARVGGRDGHGKSRVTGMDQPFAWSFRNHVEPVLAKTGLQLRRLPRRAGRQEGLQALAARLRSGGRLSSPSPSRPAAGGSCSTDPGPQPAADQADRRRFRTRAACGSRSTRPSIACWPSGSPPARRPASRRSAASCGWRFCRPASCCKPGDKQQIIVLAHFTDGHAEDVTRWVKYTSTNESVATVDDDGLVTVVGTAKGRSRAWYLSQIAIATITVAVSQQPVAAEVFAQAPRAQLHRRTGAGQARQPEPAPLAAGRATPSSSAGRIIDTIGVLPTADEVRAFLADTSPDKRDALIERCWPGPSSSTTGPTGGPTCCWSAAQQAAAAGA